MSSEAQDTAEYISFEDFCKGLPQGRFRVIVNPELAPPFVAHCTRVTPLAIALIGPGIAVALAGHPWIGALLVAAGILLRRTVKRQAPRILLHLVARLPSVYEQATEHGVMEVRRA
ncbi:hypothetical protein [Variovorax soli]|uniref:hypothetical protein n=1 Tax=Variovorax soli TaxID=376815 RepID=UPI000838E4F7|nr:hypothetical protein [Variovorax soli]